MEIDPFSHISLREHLDEIRRLEGLVNAGEVKAVVSILDERDRLYYGPVRCDERCREDCAPGKGPQ